MPRLLQVTLQKLSSYFEQSVTEGARTGTEVQGVYYKNSIYLQHFRGKSGAVL